LLFCGSLVPALALVVQVQVGGGAALPVPPDVSAARSVTSRKALAAGAAVVPGLLVHGAGHYVAGEKRTAGRLLLIEGTGIAAATSSVLALGATGAARYLAAPLIASLVGGVGLFAVSGLADIYGVLAPPGGTGAAPRTAPIVTAAFGARYLHDPHASYHRLLGAALDVRAGALRLSPSAWVAEADANHRLRAEIAYRVAGPRASLPGGATADASDGSYLDIVLGGTEDRHAARGFTMRGAEVALAGRLDLGRVGPTLAGSFAEGALGAALASYRYDGVAARDRDEVLLARFGFGIYLGRLPGPAGELSLYYDHRHDGYAGGLVTRGIGSGLAGAFGLDATFFPVSRWGVRLEAQAGSALLAGVGIVHRYGELR
jgi:hypothetical protein